MFSIFRSATRKRRSEAKELLSHAGKVLRYRRDLLSSSAVSEIETACESLRAAVAGDAAKDESGYKSASGALESLLKRHGGAVYPVGTVADWVETFVIAAILAGGVRAYIFQPFKIPTNSMYPTYHGMTAAAYPEGVASPSAWDKAVRKVTLGATWYAPEAPVAGEIYVPLIRTATGGLNFAPAAKVKDSGLLGTGLLRGAAEAHTLYVGDKPVTVVTPAEFTFSSAWLRCFFPRESAMPMPENDRISALLRAAAERGDLIPMPGSDKVLLRTHRLVREGAPVIRFEVLTGDMVIVDRVSYHFSKPTVGDAFVFRTRDVPAMRPRDDFYIKRLVGAPGDTLQVKDGKLERNGAVARGNAGFEGNNLHLTDEQYYGYLPSVGDGAFPLDSAYEVPASHYWAMGDNSANSSDSRVFGPVPERALVGRALFLLHPFGDRWGSAK